VECFGFIDQVRQYADGSLEVADLKTGTSTPGSSMQLGVYAYVVQQKTGILPTSGVFVKAGRPATAAKPVTPTRDVQHYLHGWDKSLLDSMFTDMDRAERAGIFLPNPQDGCERTCTVSEYCRIKGWGSGPAKFATITTRETLAVA
jgi:RecB family exonuclease